MIEQLQDQPVHALKVIRQLLDSSGGDVRAAALVGLMGDLLQSPRRSAPAASVLPRP